MLYCLAGDQNEDQAPMNALNTFNITSGKWSSIGVLGGPFNGHTRTSMSSAVTGGSSDGLGFALGGWADIGGMIRFDAQDPAKPKWQNETDNKPPLTLEGSMEFIRLGPQGSLISFGGYNKDLIKPDSVWRFDQRDMSQINVYDIDSATWYNVTATGDIPHNRSAFCTAVSSAPDDSSFQITMYAGYELFRNHSFADTYVLSIPSFHWINVTDASNLDADPSGGSGMLGRDHHQCVSFKDRQMLVLGGVVRRGGAIVNFKGCSIKYPAVRALDLSTFEWMDTWEADPGEYFVPKAVTRIIGGGPDGGATLKEPRDGFNDSALRTIFAKVVPSFIPPGVRASTEPGGDDSRDNPNRVDASSKSNAGTIAGAILGALLVIGIIIATVWLVRRRKRTEVHHHHGDHGQSTWSSGPYKFLSQSRELDAGYRGRELNAAPERGYALGSKPIGELPT